MDDRRRDGETNSTLRNKEQRKHLTLNEHDDDDDDKKIILLTCCGKAKHSHSARFRSVASRFSRKAELTIGLHIAGVNKSSKNLETASKF